MRVQCVKIRDIIYALVACARALAAPCLAMALCTVPTKLPYIAQD